MNKKLDYYKILGVDENASVSDLKQAYRSKLKQYHPDKIEQTDENKLKFKLIREAGDVLCDIHERKIYDNSRKNNSSDDDTIDIIKFKSEYNDFVSLMSELQKPIEKIPELESICVKKDSISDIDLVRKMEDMIFQRQNDDTESMNENIFKDEFDIEKFNNLFLKQKTCDEIVIVKSVDQNYENYCELDETQQIMSADDYEEKTIEEELELRKKQDEYFENMKTNDFDDVYKDSENISSQFGFMMGKEHVKKNIDNDTILSAYESLINSNN